MIVTRTVAMSTAEETMELKDLIRKWRREANRHERARKECAKHDEEWLMNHEAERVYDRCADELERKLAKCQVE